MVASPQEPAEGANDNRPEEVPEGEAAAEPAVQPKKDDGEALRDRIAALEEELAKARDQRLRAIAETDNIRKRAERDQTETSKYAITAFARDMVNVLENLKRASDNIPKEAVADDPLLQKLEEGVELTLKELLSIFERYGIRRIDPMGQKFDHNLHQAVAQVERDDVAPGMVIQVVQAGYTINDRLLRPAMVAVSKAATGDAPKQVDTTA
jgi:molecular chaperone GrpE